MNSKIEIFSLLILTINTTSCVSNQPDALPAKEDKRASRIQVYAFKDLKNVGTSFFPLEFTFSEGGWSGASRVQPSPTTFSKDEFWTVNDRGLNLYLQEKDSTANAKFKDGDRYFPVPRHQQQIFRIKLNPSGVGTIIERIGLRENDLPLNGLPSALENMSTSERGWEMKTRGGPFSPVAKSLQGYDLEGVAQAFDEEGQREFWMVEEYGPSLLRANASGQIVRRWSPARQFKSQSNALPWSLRHRADNRGLEGVTTAGPYVIAAMQSPLSASGGASGEVGHGNPSTPLHRILRLNKNTGLIEQFAYDHSAAATSLGSKHEDVKIGDLAPLDTVGQRFLVLEHASKRKHMRLVEARITPGVTRLGDTITYEAGKTPYKPLETRLLADIGPLLKNYELPEKAEGISVMDEKTLLIIFDNDHCIEPLLAQKNAAKECENLAITITFAEPLFGENVTKQLSSAMPHQLSERGR